MDVDDLRLFEAVAAEGSFSRAAERLRFSQPSVSTRIATVERTVGARLFDRDTRGARLTDAGHTFLGYVRRCLQLLEQAQQAAAAQGRQQVLHIGVPASYAPALAPVLVDAADHQQLAVAIRSAHSSKLRTDLVDGLIDVAFTTPGPVPVGVTSRHLIETPIVALGRPTSQATAEPVRYAIHTWDQASGELIAELLAAQTSPRMISEVSPAAAAITLALHRDYIAVVPRITATAEIHAGRLHELPIELPRLTAQIDALRPTRHPERDAIDAFTTAVRTALRATARAPSTPSRKPNPTDEHASQRGAGSQVAATVAG